MEPYKSYCIQRKETNNLHLNNKIKFIFACNFLDRSCSLTVMESVLLDCAFNQNILNPSVQEIPSMQVILS